MKRAILNTLVAITLAACAPSALPSGGNAPTPPPSATPDLFTQAANAKATVDAAGTLAAEANTSAKTIADHLTDTAAAPTAWANATNHALGVQITQQMMRITDEAGTANAATATNNASIATTTATAVIGNSLREDARKDLSLESDKATHLVVTWAPWIISFVFLALIIGIPLATYRQLMPLAVRFLRALEDRARTFITPDGDLKYIPPPGEAARVISASRMLHPVLHVGQDGVAVGSGGASDERMQDRVAARAQAATAIAALRMPRRQAARGITPLLKQTVAAETAATNEEIVEGRVREVSPTGTVGAWLDEAEQKMLEEEKG